MPHPAPALGPLSLLTIMAALAAVLALIWLGQKLARRHGFGARGNGRLRLEESIALDQRRRVHLISCSGRCLLIETGGAQDLMLGWLPEPERAA